MNTAPLTTLALAFGLATTAAAQDRLELHDADVVMDENTYAGVSVDLAATPAEVRDALEDWADDAYGVDLDYKGGILGRDKEFLITQDAHDIAPLGDRPAYLNARVVERGEGSTMTLFASYEGNVAVEPDGQYAESFAGVREMADAFLQDFVPAYYRERVTTVESSIDDLRDDIAGFRDDIRDNEDKIAKLQRENEELRANIAEAERQLEAQGETLDDRESELERAVEQVSGERE